MSADWVEITLGEFLELKRGYDLPKSIREEGEVLVVSSSGPSGTHSTPMVKAPVVVTGRYGTIGEVYYVESDCWPLNTTLYVRDFKGNDPLFAYYLLKTINYSEYSDKGAVPGVNRNHLHLAKVKVPADPVVQHEIAIRLWEMDRKISLNRQINQTLEQMAQAIFNSWFVDFDPVRAKMDNREPEGMDAATAALFPSELIESELGLIPKGWEVATLKQLTSKIGSGATPKGGREVYLDEGIALIRSQNVYDSLFVWGGLARISDDAAAQLKGVEVFPEDVLLNITGASILRTCVVVQEVLPARVNQHVSIIRAKAGVSSRYLHLHLLRRQVKEYLLGLNAGGSREAVTKGHIESVPILNPGRDLLLKFHQALEPLFSEIEQLAGQGGVLSELRDTLLPKLLSGDLKVKEV